MPKTTPPADIRPEARPHGTTADQVAAMEAEGQGQTPNPTAEAGRPPRPVPNPDAVAPPAESAAEDQAIDTAFTGLVSSDEDEAGA